MKKIGIILFSCLFLVVLTACGGSKDSEGTTKKGETVEVEIEDASYILSGQSDGDPIGEEEEGGLLLINLQVKNLSDSSINIYPDMDIHLYDGDSQIDSSFQAHQALDLENDFNDNIGANKQKTMNVMFEVDKDTEYELNISPQPVDFEEEVEDTTITIDTSEYNDSLGALQEPGDALEAYVETIYFDKDNADYEKYVSADKNDLQEDAENQFAKSLELGLSKDVPSSDVEKYYESFKQAAAEKNEVEATVIGNANNKAIVIFNYSAISYEDIADEIRDYKEKYREKHDDFDPAKEDKYALSKFDAILDKIEAKKGTQELNIEMKKDDGKWMIDDSDAKKRIMRVFAEGVVS